MKKEITLTILKEDILLNNYMHTDECPITRALARAGYPELKDTGNINGYIDDKEVSVDSEDINYNSLLNKLFGMYNHEFKHNYRNQNMIVSPIPVEDFTHTIIIEL